MDREQARQKSRQRYLEFRVEAPKFIRAQGISCVVWAEDALAYYGVPIVSSELFVLVANVGAATRCLRNIAYATEAAREWEPLPELMEGSSRLRQPPAESGGLEPAPTSYQAIVVLLPAERWKYTLPPEPLSTKIPDLDPFPFPPLPALLDSIIDAWLDAPATYFVSHIGCHLAYIYGYIDQVHAPCFLDKLHPAHRDFHLHYLTAPIRASRRLEWRRRRDTTWSDGGWFSENTQARATRFDEKHSSYVSSMDDSNQRAFRLSKESNLMWLRVRRMQRQSEELD